MIYALLSEYKSLQKIKVEDPNQTLLAQRQNPSSHGPKPVNPLHSIHGSGSKKKHKIALGLGNMNQNSIDQELLVVEAPADMGAA